jgi:hypothetical protein
MDPQITSALIALLVALVTSVSTVVVTNRARESDEKRQEKEHRRNLTERLLTLRLAAYPSIFSITQDLSRQQLFTTPPPTVETLTSFRYRIKDWERDQGAFLMTTNSLKRFRALSNALNLGENAEATEQRLQKIWEAKNALRGALKADLTLLFEEDQSPPRTP